MITCMGKSCSFGLPRVPFVKICQLDRIKRIWYLSSMRAAKVQASLRIRAVSPEPPLLAHTSCESRGTFKQKARSLAPLNGWTCAVEICHDGMLEDTNSLDGAQFMYLVLSFFGLMAGHGIGLYQFLIIAYFLLSLPNYSCRYLYSSILVVIKNLKKSDGLQNSTMHHQNELVMTTLVHLYDAWYHSVTHLIFSIHQYRACCM